MQTIIEIAANITDGDHVILPDLHGERYVVDVDDQGEFIILYLQDDWGDTDPIPVRFDTELILITSFEDD